MSSKYLYNAINLNGADFGQGIMGKLEYSKPGMRIECFNPQEYAQACEYYIDGIDPINSAEIGSNTKFWVDSNQDGIINGSDFDSDYTNQTDGHGWTEAHTVIKAWWADKPKIAEDIFNDHSLFGTYQSQGLAGYVDAVLNSSSSSGHYYAGSVTRKRNHS